MRRSSPLEHGRAEAAAADKVTPQRECDDVSPLRGDVPPLRGDVQDVTPHQDVPLTLTGASLWVSCCSGANTTEM